ncbi:glycosyltransferase [Thiohalophilus thiocyanatoxydans]|uniref:Glycosyltransferase involved in cell wall biosynthesis n=1 Tax=Thiohalophilus thiocyanatoxydans TaxID=381308 RepID=A0A4V3H4E5_9GAMM|nr:glycosyltransferase [Thiohalophilus thiocyanatoxydans]TDY02915.1 glycosyltransferase involved in cell wall biosynthesis [Thiohalophilus thiocyanatoxydans]
MSSNYAIIIPAYNEARTLRNIAKSALDFSNIVIVVNDGSQDETSQVVKDLPVLLIEHVQNQGKAASLWQGIQEARKHQVDYYVTLDGDGQHSPSDIPRLLSKLEQYPDDIIIGARLADKSAIPAKRYYANRIANFWLAWAAGYPLSDSQSGFRIYPARLFEDLKISTSKRSSFVFESEILIKAAQRGIKSQAVTIPAVYTPNARPSHFRGVRDISLITLMVARHLFRRGMYPKGLYRSAIKPRLLPEYQGKPEYAGYLMGLLSLLVIILTLGISLLGVFLYIKKTAREETCPEDRNYAVILGKRLKDNQPDQEYIHRLDTALQLYHKNHQLQFYLLGGITANMEISESSAGAKYLIRQGVKPELVHTEGASRNTLENLTELRENLPGKDQEIILITSQYHQARAGYMARQFGFQVYLCPAKPAGSRNMFMKYIGEAVLLHWYITGLLYSRATNNKAWLSRISR